jgi:hypothetical protein
MGKTPKHWPMIRPGDMLCGSGNGLLSAAINVGTFGWPCRPLAWRGYSHTAVVAKDVEGTPVVWESTSLSKCPCVRCHRTHDGVQSHWLYSWILGYAGAVWHFALSEWLERDQQIALAEYLEKLHATKYDALGAFRARQTPLSAVERLLGWYSRESLDRLYCTEIVAAADRQIGLQKTPNASRWNPNSYARACIDMGLRLAPTRLT